MANGFAVMRFNEELGDNMGDRPNFAGTAFVGLQSTIQTFDADNPRGDGYILLNVAGMHNERAQVFLNGVEMPGQNFDPIPVNNDFTTTLVHIHNNIVDGSNTLQFRNAAGSGDNWVINHVVVHWR
ncbi:MAG: hypothetical protein QF578_14020 [Alphaproteobacteria bacterium]|nr:hypothetical protein [Alphaproteobacteria bacterium]